MKPVSFKRVEFPGVDPSEKCIERIAEMTDTVSGYGPIVAKRMLGEMNDAYDAAVAKLTECNGQAPTDAQIYAYMMTFSFRPIRKFRSDFTGGRYGVGYYLNQ